MSHRATLGLLLALLLPGGVAAGDGDPAGAPKVPRDRPRLCVTAAELPGLRERLAGEAGGEARTLLLARAEAFLRDDPADPAARYGSLQPRCHALAEEAATLAFAGLVGDEALRTRAADWLARLDVGPLERQLPAAEYMPRGELLYGLPLAYDWAAAWAPPAALERLRAAIVRLTTANFDGIAQQRNWEGKIDANNHAMAAIGGVGVAGLALWHEEPAAREWVALAARKVAAYRAQSFDADGAGYEGNLYGPFGLGMALPFAAALRHAGGADLLGDGFLVRALHWCVSDAIPGDPPVLNPRNDASGSSLPTNLALFTAHAYRDGVSRWIAEQRGTGAWAPWVALFGLDLPAAEAPGAPFRARWHAGRGLLNVRTGFAAGDWFASFECGARPAGTHCQADHGQVTWHGGGGAWLVDAGYSNEAKEGSGNQTVAHSLVLIDGKGQALSGGGTVVEGRMLAEAADEVCAVAVADLAPAYGTRGYNPVQKALRTFAWVWTAGAPYAVIVDEIVKDAQPHRFESCWHTAAANRVEWDGASAVLRAPGGAAARLRFVGTKGPGETRTMDFGSYLGAHPVCVVAGQGTGWFGVTLLAAEGEAGVEIAAKPKGRGVEIVVIRPEATDRVTVTPGAGPKPARLELVREAGGKAVYRRRG